MLENHRIPFRTIKYRTDGTHKKTAGGQIFSDAKENSLIKLIQVFGEWGCALSTTDIRMIAKRMLSKEGRQVRCFKDNLPGLGWVSSILKGDSTHLSLRQAQNIKAARAENIADEINKYFDNLAVSMANVPPECIIIYDEKNLSDDPGKAKLVFKSGTKYLERILNNSKSCTSIVCRDVNRSHLGTLSSFQGGTHVRYLV